MKSLISYLTEADTSRLMAISLCQHRVVVGQREIGFVLLQQQHGLGQRAGQDAQLALLLLQRGLQPRQPFGHQGHCAGFAAGGGLAARGLQLVAGVLRHAAGCIGEVVVEGCVQDGAG